MSQSRRPRLPAATDRGVVQEIKGKLVYFGRDPDVALERHWQHCNERRIAGKGHGGVTLADDHLRR